MRRIEQLYDFIFRTAEVVLILVAVLVFIAVTVAVFSRFVLNASVPWADELPALALIWLTFLGAAVLSKRNENLNFDGVSASLPISIQRILDVFNSLVIPIFLAILVYYGWKFTVQTWSRTAITLPLNIGLVRLVVPLSGVLMMLVYVNRIYRAVRGLPLAQPEGDQ